MNRKILVTGGAGFIGSFIVDALIKTGHDVRIFDNLDPQVHSDGKPDYINPKAEFILGDITNRKQLSKALEDVEIIFHEASAVGVGQSMYKIAHYTKVNSYGTALLLDLIVNSNNNVKKIIFASSMVSYGEGLYKCEDDGLVRPGLRPEKQLKAKEWECKCPICKKEIKPVPTPEDIKQNSVSIYAINKKNQEEMMLNVGKIYGIPIVALRYFNVFGPRQSLSNPYTGVVAIFMSRIKNNNPPIVYEDGLQTRDFISVYDVVNANLLAMEKNSGNYQVFNVGSGNPITIKSIAETIAKLYGKNIKPNISGKFRKWDIRHCYADISKIRDKLEFEVKTSFEEDLKELISWSAKKKATDKFDIATKELEERGLI